MNDTGTSSHQNMVTKRLLSLLERSDYELVQENGQRRLTLKTPTERTKGAEVFLGRLPRDCYEDELVPVLERVGRVVELRLMMDFSGSTRGYAFALFDHQRIAREACAKLDGFEIRPGHHIGVVKSVDNCRLFLGGVPKDKSKQDFMEELSKILEGITNIYLYPSTHDTSLNRGFIFVEFRDHRSAAMARRKLIPGRVLLWNHEVAVDWADPEPGDDVDDDVMQTVSALFVRNILLETTEAQMKQIFQNTTGIPIMKLKKINHFAFLHYESRRQAEHVLYIMTRPQVLAKHNWEITWAKPIKKIKNTERQRHMNDSGDARKMTPSSSNELAQIQNGPVYPLPRGKRASGSNNRSNLYSATSPSTSKASMNANAAKQCTCDALTQDYVTNNLTPNSISYYGFMNIPHSDV